jgi:hypothetical protein
MVLQLVKKFPAFYGTWQFITVLTNAHLEPTLGSVNGNVIGSRISSSVTSLILSSCPWLTSFRSPLRTSMLFCKSTTVMTVVLTHCMKLNTIRTISCSVKTYNICYVQIYWIATYKITNTKESPKQKTLLLQNIMADGCTMFRVPIMRKTIPVHTSTLFT